MSKKNSWILISLGIATIAFIISWLLLGYWKVSLIVAVISGLITLSLNPIRRYMKAFWSVFSLLITLNSMSLKFVLKTINRRETLTLPIMMKDKKQEGGDGSSNIQAENVNVYNGITYKDAKEIALDVFNSNFIRLKSEAAQIAAERAEEITEKNEKSPESLEEFKNPAMQDALFQTQKEYAKSGDEELGNLLVDILVDRAKTQERNMLQLVLDESLLVAPKLTVEHFDLLTCSNS